MAFIIPDRILENFTCEICEKYLSVRPVKISKDGTIKCGRCSKRDNESLISTYNFVAENSLFRCINRYDGCPELLTYSNTSSHEEHCFSRSYECPICLNPSKLSSLLLLHHFKKEHAEHILNSPELVVDLFSSCEYHKWYLYKN